MEKYTKEQLEKKLDELFEQNENSIEDIEGYYWMLSVSCYMPRRWQDEIGMRLCFRCGKHFVFQKYSMQNKIAEICNVLRNKGFDTWVNYYCDACIENNGGKIGELKYKKNEDTKWKFFEFDDETIEQLMCYCRQDNSGDDK